MGKVSHARKEVVTCCDWVLARRSNGASTRLADARRQKLKGRFGDGYNVLQRPTTDSNDKKGVHVFVVY